jgi:hypothetical protein
VFSSGQDIGNVAAAGFDTYDSVNGRYTVQGSGADIWGAADEFRYLSTALTGDFTIATRVESVQNVDPWTKAGVMIRESLDANARHAFALVTPERRLVPIPAPDRRPDPPGDARHRQCAGLAADHTEWQSNRRVVVDERNDMDSPGQRVDSDERRGVHRAAGHEPQHGRNRRRGVRRRADQALLSRPLTSFEACKEGQRVHWSVLFMTHQWIIGPIS